MKITAAMLRMLRAINTTGDPFDGIVRPSRRGGGRGTLRGLLRRGMVRRHNGMMVLTGTGIAALHGGVEVANRRTLPPRPCVRPPAPVPREAAYNARTDER